LIFGLFSERISTKILPLSINVDREIYTIILPSSIGVDKNERNQSFSASAEQEIVKETRKAGTGNDPGKGPLHLIPLVQNAGRIRRDLLPRAEGRVAETSGARYQQDTALHHARVREEMHEAGIIRTYVTAEASA
jgi:hypothetical protein